MYSGYFISLGSKQRFVIPAIMQDVIASMLGEMMEHDPQDVFTIHVRWGEANQRPDYSTVKLVEN